MPTFEYLCLNKKCQHEWEDIVLMKEEEPSKCPECKSKKIQKLISLPSLGIVELTGLDWKKKIKEDAGKMVVEASRNENVLENLVGTSTLEKNQKVQKELKSAFPKSERPKIKKSRRS